MSANTFATAVDPLIPDGKVCRSSVRMIESRRPESSRLSSRVTHVSTYKTRRWIAATQLLDKATSRLMNKTCRTLARAKAEWILWSRLVEKISRVPPLSARGEKYLWHNYRRHKYLISFLRTVRWIYKNIAYILNPNFHTIDSSYLRKSIMYLAK